MDWYQRLHLSIALLNHNAQWMADMGDETVWRTLNAMIVPRN